MQRGEIRREGKRSCTALHCTVRVRGAQDLRGYGASAYLQRTTEPVHLMLACSMQDAKAPAPATGALLYDAIARLRVACLLHCSEGSAEVRVRRQAGMEVSHIDATIHPDV